MDTLFEKNKYFIIDQNDHVIESNDCTSYNHWSDIFSIHKELVEPFYLLVKEKIRHKTQTPFLLDGESCLVTFIALEKNTLVSITQEVDDVVESSESELEKEILLRFVGHQIQHPITLIKGYMDLFLDEPNKNYKTILEREVDGISKLVKHLIQVLKISPKYISERSERINFNSFMVRLIEREKDHLAGFSVEYIDHISPETCVIKGDEVLLLEAIYTLCENIYKYVSKDTRVLFKTYKEGSNICLELLDEGDGIPEEKKEHLFTPFKRGEENIEGSGLGLYLVKKIIDSHNGSISLEETNSGTCFKIRLPLS